MTVALPVASDMIVQSCLVLDIEATIEVNKRQRFRKANWLTSSRLTRYLRSEVET